MEEGNAKKSRLFIFSAAGLFALAVLVLVMLALSSKSSKDDARNEPSATDAGIESGAAGNTDGNGKAGEAASRLKPISDGDHTWGSDDANVSIIIYSDFSCPFCADFYDTTEQLKKEFEGKVRIAFRHFYFPSHANAFPAALASECASEQGRFWEMHDKLFDASKTEALDDEIYAKLAEELGLDAGKFSSCMKSRTYADKILRSVSEAKSIGVMGTPTLYVNGEILTGAYPLDDFTGNDGRQYEGLRKIINSKLGSKK